MATVTAPLCVSTPPASYARMVMVRSEPAGSVMMPSATRSVTEILKTSLAAMSGAVTSTTTVATVVPERSALTSRVVSAGRDRDPVGSLGKQEPSANRDAIAAATRTGTLPGTGSPCYGVTLTVAVPATPRKVADIVVLPDPIAVT